MMTTKQIEQKACLDKIQAAWQELNHYKTLLRQAIEFKEAQTLLTEYNKTISDKKKAIDLLEEEYKGLDAKHAIKVMSSEESAILNQKMTEDFARRNR